MAEKSNKGLVLGVVAAVVLLAGLEQPGLVALQVAAELQFGHLDGDAVEEGVLGLRDVMGRRCVGHVRAWSGAWGQALRAAVCGANSWVQSARISRFARVVRCVRSSTSRSVCS